MSEQGEDSGPIKEAGTEDSGVDESTSKRRRVFAWLAVLAVILLLLFSIYRYLDSGVAKYDLRLVPTAIPADGVSSAILEVKLTSRFGHALDLSALPHAPKVEVIEGGELVQVYSFSDSLRYRIVAKLQRGTAVIHVTVPGLPVPMEATLDLTASLADYNHNDYPDALDLNSDDDKEAFRKWFTCIALGQATHLDDGWTERDCAGLIRYCYREALKKHDSTWFASRRWLVTAAIPDVRKYNYPKVPLVGTRIFRVGTEVQQPDVLPAGLKSGSSQITDTSDDGFSNFAEAARLKDNSLAFVSRSEKDALPGDLIFYLNDTESNWPYHSMIYLGNGQTIYHTGPDNEKPGIVKQMTFAQLSAHPNPRWHPVASNPYFLGFYRWRILL